MPAERKGDPTRTLARTIRAARGYSGMDRRELAKKLGMSSEQVGRYERGEWNEPPKRAIVQAIAIACSVPDDFMHVGFSDPAKRFADRTRQEADRQRERPGSGPAARPGADGRAEDA